MYRAKNQAPPLSYNATIADFSKQWSNYLLKNSLFQHSGTQLYGENLAYFEGYGSDAVTLVKLSIDAWYNEISSYDFKNPGFSEATGHFTCLVWLTSREYGISIAFDPVTTKAIITMNTSPPGNVIGQFAENVLPLISPVIPVPPPVNPVVPVPPPVIPVIPVPPPVIPVIPVPPPVIPVIPVPPPVIPVIPVPPPVIPVPPPVIPVPTPVSEPSVIYDQSNISLVKQIISILYNVIYSINVKRPRSYILSQLQTTIHLLVVLNNIPISNGLINIIMMVMRAIQTQKSSLSIKATIQNIITSLYPYANF
jgi:hypothetical protein